MNHRATYTESSILDACDRAARAYSFIFLDGGKEVLADTRIKIYRDNARWVIVLEQLDFFNPSPGHDGIINRVHKIGNCVQVNNERAGTDYDAIRVTGDGPGPPAFEQPDCLDVNPQVETIRIRDKVVPVDLSPTNLKRKGIPLPKGSWVSYRDHQTGEMAKEWFPARLDGQHLLWSLLPGHRDELLATEEEKRRRLPNDLPKFMQLEEWHHPELLTQRTMPSESRTFQLLAKAIVSGNAADYRPTLPPNTHWRNWLGYDRI